MDELIRHAALDVRSQAPQGDGPACCERAGPDGHTPLGEPRLKDVSDKVCHGG